MKPDKQAEKAPAELDSEDTVKATKHEQQIKIPSHRMTEIDRTQVADSKEFESSDEMDARVEELTQSILRLKQEIAMLQARL